MKKILFFALLFLVFLPSSVKAECDDSEIIRLQKLGKNVSSSYLYNETSGRFTITLANLKKDLIVEESDTGKIYSTDGELNFFDLMSGKHSYDIYAKDRECIEDEITTVYVKLPYYNRFYNSEECKNIKNYSYCSKWVEKPLSYDIWHEKVTNYKQTVEEKKKSKQTNTLFEQLKDFYGKYYYIILPSIILIGVAIVIKNRKDSLV